MSVASVLLAGVLGCASQDKPGEQQKAAAAPEKRAYRVGSNIPVKDRADPSVTEVDGSALDSVRQYPTMPTSSAAGRGP